MNGVILLLSILSLALSRLELCQAQSSDPTQFNGGSILAMAGRNSVAIAIDARFGLGMQTISTGDDHDAIGNDRVAGGGSPRILHLPNSNVLLAWSGLYGDGMGFAEEMNLLLGRKVRRAGCMGFQRHSSGCSFGSVCRRRISPRSVTMLMSHLLYRRKNAPYYVEPVIVGLETVRVPVSTESNSLSLKESLSKELQLITDEKTLIDKRRVSSDREQAMPKPNICRTIHKPYLCGTDMLGAQSTSHSFVCSGVASRSLHGTAEALWKPNMEAEELVEVCGRAFVSALERDCLSGYGAVVYLIQTVKCGENIEGEEDDVKIIEYILACRND